MLGPEVEKYGPNVKVAVIAFVLGALFCVPFWFGAKEANNRTGWAIFFAVASFFALFVAYLVSSRASLHVDGVSCRSIFGEKEMRWTEVERFRYGSHEVIAQGIALGAFYQIKLIDEHGSTISFGDRIGRAAEFIQKLNQLTFETLMQKATRHFDSGAELDFGAIHLSRSNGLSINRWFGTKETPWQELVSCHMGAADTWDTERFSITRVGKKLPQTQSIPVERLYNAAVLLALINRTLSRGPC